MSKQQSSPEGKDKPSVSPPNDLPNPFRYVDVYPDASSIFLPQSESINDVLDKAIFVLDTNVLLVPYGTTQHALSEIERVYQELAKENRLFIPGHVAREFAVNRVNKIKELYNHLSKQRSISLSEPNTSILNDNEKFNTLKAAKLEVDEKIKDYRKQLNAVLDEVASWMWRDPVSIIYSQIFDTSNIIDNPIDRKRIITIAEERKINQLPPGYKDLGKEDNPYGDLIIWETIIEISKNKSSPIIFVSHDEKADWWTKSDNTSLYPRFELIYEFKRETGQSLHIIKLSELMSIFKANPNVISEVKIEESRPQIGTSSKRSDHNLTNFNKIYYITNHIYDYVSKYTDEVSKGSAWITAKIDASEYLITVEYVDSSSLIDSRMKDGYDIASELLARAINQINSAPNEKIRVVPVFVLRNTDEADLFKFYTDIILAGAYSIIYCAWDDGNFKFSYTSKEGLPIPLYVAVTEFTSRDQSKAYNV